MILRAVQSRSATPSTSVAQHWAVLKRVEVERQEKVVDPLPLPLPPPEVRSEMGPAMAKAAKRVTRIAEYCMLK